MVACTDVLLRQRLSQGVCSNSRSFLVLLEQARSLPVLSSRVAGDNADVTNSSQCGLLVET